MSALSIMELSAKSPFLWDLENLVMFNTKAGEAPKTLQLVDSEFEGIEAFEVGSYYSSGGRSDGGTGSDLGYTSSTKSSKSASDDSSTDREIKETKFSFETNDSFQQDLSRKRDYAKYGPSRTSPTMESSAVSGESLTALELCNRTYFEDDSGFNNGKYTAQTLDLSDSSAKKSKTSSISVETPRCQVEGCNMDLSSAKDYHRKHRVCENHSKSPKVVINGVERRFCQQCSRFHGLSEFDQKKRSCRRRLSDHNARRRKPKPEVIQFNSMRLASSLYEGRNQLNFGFNQAPELQTRHGGSWDSTRDSKVTLAKPGPYATLKSEGTDDLHLAHSVLHIPQTKVSSVSSHFLPSKGAPSEVYQRGLPVSVAASNIDAAQDLRALSLLSTSSWGSCDPEPSSIEHTMHANNSSFPAMHVVPLGGGPVSSVYWQTEPPTSSGPGSHTSSFQLFKAPHESSFYLY